MRLFIAILLAMTVACSASEPVVLAASSLHAVAEDILAAGGLPGTVSSAGSQVLAAQLEAGAPAALLLLADPELAEDLFARGLADEPVPVARTRLAILSAPGVVATTLPDLLDLSIVLADASVPLGRYTRQALAKAGLEREVLARAVSFEDSARLVVAKVAMGEVDAAIVYEADIPAGLTATPLSAEVNVVVTYTAQNVDGGAALLDLFVGSSAIWAKAGFEPAP